MKIGILTMHKVVNYGSQLQAYALQTFLKNIGFDSEIVDYDYPNEYHFSEGTNHRPPQLGFIQQIAKLFWLRPFWVKQNRFERFPARYMKLTRRYSTRAELEASIPHYDVLITGSDQVWNYKYLHEDYSFLLPFADSKTKKISYASSFASSDIPLVAKSKYSELLNQYRAISVRK